MRGLSPLIVVFVSCLLSSIAFAKEEWLVAHYGNFEFQSNLTEKQTDALIEEFHYFAQTIDRLFPNLGILGRFPVHIVLTDRAKTFEQYSGGKFDVSKSKSIWGTVDGFNSLVVYVKNPRRPAQSSSLMFRAVAAELFRESDVTALWFSRGISMLFSTVDITAYGNIDIGKPIDLRFSENPSSDRYDTQPELLTAHFLDAETFFGMKTGTEDHKDKIKRALLNIQSWICIHYAIFNEDTTLIQRLVQYAIHSQKQGYSPEAFEKIVGISAPRFIDDLKSYAERGKFGFSEMKKSDLPDYHSVEIQPASAERIDSTRLAVLLSTRNWEQSIELLRELNARNPMNPDVLEANFFAHQIIDARWVEQKTILDSDPDEDLLAKATREFNRLEGWERADLDTILDKALAAGVVNHELGLVKAKRMIDLAEKQKRNLKMKEIGQINGLLAQTISKNNSHLEALQLFVKAWSMAEKPAPESLLPHIIRAMKTHPNDFVIWKSALVVFEKTGNQQESVDQIKKHLGELSLTNSR